MATYFRLLDVGRQFFDSNGDPLNGGKLYTYEAGTTTNKTTYQDSTGSSAHANPIILDSAGRISAEVWGTTGAYKLKLDDSANSNIWSRDDVSGINDTAETAASEWISSGLTPTYISASSFSFAGDQTSVFHAGRRLKITDNSGTIYGTIKSSVFGAVTTITVDVDASGSLTSPVTAVQYGLLGYTNSSIPINPLVYLSKNTLSSSASSIFTLDTTLYSAFLIRFMDVTPATDGVDLRIAIGTGGVFDAGTNYRWTRMDINNAGTSAISAGTGGAFAIGALTVSNQVQRKINGTLFLTSLADYPRFHWDITHGNTTDTMLRVVGGGQDNIAAARDQIRFLFSSGNIASGSMSLYGYPV